MILQEAAYGRFQLWKIFSDHYMGRIAREGRRRCRRRRTRRASSVRRRYSDLFRPQKTGAIKVRDAAEGGDCVEILSGVFEGKTTGPPYLLLFLIVTNGLRIMATSRPSIVPVMPIIHLTKNTGADRDYRGDGRCPPAGKRSRGALPRRQSPRKILSQLGITLTTYTKSIGPVCCRSFERGRNHAKSAFYAGRRRSGKCAGLS